MLSTNKPKLLGIQQYLTQVYTHTNKNDVSAISTSIITVTPELNTV